jgi:hypothetical protein
MNDELGKIWKGAVVAWSKYYSGICLERPRKTTKNSRHDRHFLGRDSNHWPPELKPWALPQHQPVGSFITTWIILKVFALLPVVLTSVPKAMDVGEAPRRQASIRDQVMWDCVGQSGTGVGFLIKFKKRKIKKWSYPCNRLWRPVGLWEVEDPTLLSIKSTYRLLWGCQSYAPATLYSPETSFFFFWY